MSDSTILGTEDLFYASLIENNSSAIFYQPHEFIVEYIIYIGDGNFTIKWRLQKFDTFIDALEFHMSVEIIL